MQIKLANVVVLVLAQMGLKKDLCLEEQSVKSLREEKRSSKSAERILADIILMIL